MCSVMEFHVCALCTCVDCRKIHSIACVDCDRLKVNKKGGSYICVYWLPRREAQHYKCTPYENKSVCSEWQQFILSNAIKTGSSLFPITQTSRGNATVFPQSQQPMQSVCLFPFHFNIYLMDCRFMWHKTRRT